VLTKGLALNIYSKAVTGGGIMRICAIYSASECDADGGCDEFSDIGGDED
jgi:hypothetical protein